MCEKMEKTGKRKERLRGDEIASIRDTVNNKEGKRTESSQATASQ